MAVAMMFDELCGNCKFFLLTEGKDGKCRRYPPTIVNSNEKVMSRSPRITSNYWCGQWKPSDKALIAKYPALKDAYDHYATIRGIIGDGDG